MPDEQQTPLPPSLLTCPYCGGATLDQPRCAACGGLLDPLSRQATQNAMGPWFVRDDGQPHRPGCSYETILALIGRGKITAESVLRGPTTAQFWYPARRVPGVAHRLGVCHACQGAVTNEPSCPACHASFEVEGDRQTLGLLPIRLIPGTTQEVATKPQKPAVSMTAAPIPAIGVAESRRRAAEAAATRRNATVLGLTLGVVVIGVIAGVLAFAGRGSTPAAAPAGMPRASLPVVEVPVAAEPVRAETEPNASAADARPPTPEEKPDPAVPREPGSVARPQPVPDAAPRQAELETLRRTRLP